MALQYLVEVWIEIYKETRSQVYPHLFKQRVITDLELEMIWTDDNPEVGELDVMIVEFLNCVNSVWRDGLIDLASYHS
jgi:hypothetical protein